MEDHALRAARLVRVDGHGGPSSQARAVRTGAGNAAPDRRLRALK